MNSMDVVNIMAQFQCLDSTDVYAENEFYWNTSPRQR